MKPLEIDHFFCFTEIDPIEAHIMEQNGFVVAEEFVHTNQGTACRFVMFENNYLEFIYLKNLEEARNNQFNLESRGRWKENGNCPYGISLRGSIPDELKDDFILYEPDYINGCKIYFYKKTLKDYLSPEIFVFDLDGLGNEELKPINKLSPKNKEKRLGHKIKSFGIESIEVFCKSNQELKILDYVENIKVINSDYYMAKLKIDRLQKTIVLNEVLELK